MASMVNIPRAGGLAMHAFLSLADRIQSVFNVIVGANDVDAFPAAYLERPAWRAYLQELQTPAVWRRRRIFRDRT